MNTKYEVYTNVFSEVKENVYKTIYSKKSWIMVEQLYSVFFYILNGITKNL